MKACLAKLQSKKGASLILAAVFFLLCAFVGGTVLAAATGGTAHLANQRSDEQRYLLQRSAAFILKDELNKGLATGYFQVILEHEENYRLEIVNPSSAPTPLQILTAHGTMKVYGNEIADFQYTYSNCGANADLADYPPEGVLLLSMSEEESGTAVGEADVLMIAYRIDDNYDLTLSIQDDEGHSLLHVYMKANVSAEANGDQTVITWNEPVIRKGDGGV